jgi:hypothetical protein
MPAIVGTERSWHASRQNDRDIHSSRQGILDSPIRDPSAFLNSMAVGNALRCYKPKRQPEVANALHRSSHLTRKRFATIGHGFSLIVARAALREGGRIKCLALSVYFSVS